MTLARPGRRFTDHAPAHPEQVMALRADHPALTGARTLFPGKVQSAGEARRLLVSGANQRKLGDRVSKGPWKGMPLYSLTLEERATCPDTCHHWATCYGNGMPFARRYQHGRELEERLADELAFIQRQHPKGFVVRLHLLGDFYSVAYVALWTGWLDRFPALRVFGYTAWQPGTEIGDAVIRLREARWDRFAVRTSGGPQPAGAVTLWRNPEGPRVPEGIVCPAQTGQAECCGSCGLCWAPAAKGLSVAFVAHGRTTGRPYGPRLKPTPTKGGSCMTTATLAPTAALPLTKRSLAAFQRWRETTGLARRTWEQACLLHPDEVRALETLEANLQACGDPASWWRQGAAAYRDAGGALQLEARTAGRLVAGLLVPEALLGELVRACPVLDGWPQRALEAGLAKALGPAWEGERAEWERRRAAAECERLAREAMRAAMAEKEASEMVTATSNGHEREPLAMRSPLYRRVADELDRRGTDLGAKVPDVLKNEVAAKLGTTRGTVGAAISAIRKYRGIDTPTLAAAEEAPTCEQCGKPRHPNSARVCRACYEAAGAALAVVEVQSAAVLNEPLITEREPEPAFPLGWETGGGESEPHAPETTPAPAFVADLGAEAERLRQERDQTARMLEEVQRERDEAVRENARLRDEHNGSLVAYGEAQTAAESLKAQCDTYAEAVDRLEGVANQLERERDAALAAARAEPADAWAPLDLSAPCRQKALWLASGSAVTLEHHPLEERLATCGLAVELLEVATR